MWNIDEYRKNVRKIPESRASGWWGMLGTSLFILRVHDQGMGFQTVVGILSLKSRPSGCYMHMHLEFRICGCEF